MLHAKLVISAARASDFPATGLPEIAMVGRSNVGKSSLINALVKQKIARTSAAPGKTRLANYYLIEPAPNLRFYLVDLPGYGYARGGRESVEEFEALTQQYFDPSSRPGRMVSGVLHLIDARHPELPQDAAAFQWLIRTQLPIAIVATKMDKLKRAEQVRLASTLEKKYGSMVIPESIVSGAGMQEVWKTMRGWARAGNPQPGER